MLSPLAVELLVDDRIRDRLTQAAQHALARQLPRAHSRSFDARLDVLARQVLASGLRGLAARLDPCLNCEPNLVIANSR